MACERENYLLFCGKAIPASALSVKEGAIWAGDERVLPSPRGTPEPVGKMEFTKDEELNGILNEGRVLSEALEQQGVPAEEIARQVKKLLLEKKPDINVSTTDIYYDVLVSLRGGGGASAYFNKRDRAEDEVWGEDEEDIKEVDLGAGVDGSHREIVEAVSKGRRLVVVDKDFVKLFPQEEAVAVRSLMEEVLRSGKSVEQKINQIGGILRVPLDVARKIVEKSSF